MTVNNLYRVLILTLIFASAVGAEPASRIVPTAIEVDRLILADEQAVSLPQIDDATFLRRISLDLIGRPATPGEITRFGLDPSADKRSVAVDRLLDSDEYGENWARYWRDAILLRSTNVRSGIVRESFEAWMADSLNENRPWDDIVADLLTSTGTVTEEGSTALFFAHEGQAEEVAAEASRLFMGIQIQCANCHDHPWDRWKRDEFHEFVAFFPRVSVRRDRSTDDRRAYIVQSMNQDERRRRGVSDFLLTRIDRNRDQVITKQEAGKSPLRRLFGNEDIMGIVDSNGDGRLTFEEIKTARPPQNNRPGRGSTEHFMPNLENPASEGTQVDPVFFLNDRTIKPGSDDMERRTAVSRFITSRGNEWFARAIVNRMWAELTGTTFYTPVDDIGPDREASHEAALDTLCQGFVKSRYDLKWLLRAIVATDIYQRDMQTDVEGFARMEPARLRSDQLYDLLCQSLGVSGMDNLPVQDRRRYRGEGRGRGALAETFGFDPSTSRDEIVGSIPQVLFLMNSPRINELISGRGSNSPIGRITRVVADDDDAVSELYLTVLGREPQDGELQVCRDYLSETSDTTEAMEDIFWALLNSSEYLTKR